MKEIVVSELVKCYGAHAEVFRPLGDNPVDVSFTIYSDGTRELSCPFLNRDLGGLCYAENLKRKSQGAVAISSNGVKVCPYLYPSTSFAIKNPEPEEKKIEQVIKEQEPIVGYDIDDHNLSSNLRNKLVDLGLKTWADVQLSWRRGVLSNHFPKQGRKLRKELEQKLSEDQNPQSDEDSGRIEEILDPQDKLYSKIYKKGEENFGI